MGVFNAAAVAIRGGLDWAPAFGTVDSLREQVEAMPSAMEMHGDGLFVLVHPHDPKAEYTAALDEAWQHLEAARQLCIDVLVALP